MREAALVPDLPTDASGLSSIKFHPALGGIGGSVVFLNEQETKGSDIAQDDGEDGGWSEDDGRLLDILSTGV